VGRENRTGRHSLLHQIHPTSKRKRTEPVTECIQYILQRKRRLKRCWARERKAVVMVISNKAYATVSAIARESQQSHPSTQLPIAFVYVKCKLCKLVEEERQNPWRVFTLTE